MTVALAGRAPATFEIKSATLPLVALLLKSPDLSRLAEELAGRFGDMPDFFDNDPLVIDLGALPRADDAPVDFGELLHVLRAYRVHPVAVRGGTAAQMRAAQAAGLAAAPDARIDMPRPNAAEQEMARLAQEIAQLDAPPVPAPPPDITPSHALIIDKPVRSGQQIYARQRDIVLMAMVNPGAEVIADGSIHAYAPLRGRAIAGARGNTEARIFTLSLEPELVSIAGVYRTSETPWPDSVRGRPAQVRLAGNADAGKLLVEPLAP